MKNEINACLPQVLGIVVSVCMAHGWQLEAETGLQVSLCVFLCACYCVLCASVWRKWLAVDFNEIGPQVCICVFFGVCVQVFVLPVFEEHSWQLEEESGPQVRVVCVWFCLCVCVGVFVQNTWLEARTRNGTSGKRKSCSCSVNLPCYHVYNMSVCMFLSWCLSLKHTWMIGGQDNLNQDLSLCICLSMMLNVGCMFYS